MRTEIVFRLICSVCGGVLEAETPARGTTAEHEYGIGSSGASNMKATMTIKPCERCMAAALKPGALLAQAMEAAREQVGRQGDG